MEILVFYSYSHRDEELRNELAKHLTILKRSGLIRDWRDRRILPGEKWDQEISAHLEAAHVILLLISADFLASSYCYDIEMKRALERHDTGEARVIPVILRPVLWKPTPFNRLQALPADARPVTGWPSLDLAFLNICEGILAVLIAWKRVGSGALLATPEEHASPQKAAYTKTPTRCSPAKAGARGKGYHTNLNGPAEQI